MCVESGVAGHTVYTECRAPVCLGGSHQPAGYRRAGSAPNEGHMTPENTPGTSERN